jgi:predicted HTH transcriptional regulator
MKLMHVPRGPHKPHCVREGDGLGVLRMIGLCRENGIREPDFALVGDEVVVTLYSRRYGEFHGTVTHD